MSVDPNQFNPQQAYPVQPQPYAAPAGFVPTPGYPPYSYPAQPGWGPPVTSSTRMNGWGIASLAVAAGAMLFALIASGSNPWNAQDYAIIGGFVAVVALGLWVPAVVFLNKREASNPVVVWIALGIGLLALIISIGVGIWAQDQINDFESIFDDDTY